ncbi:MAG: hypothetical protein ACE5I2_09830, partial [Anaerolineae bacterium]
MPPHKDPAAVSRGFDALALLRFFGSSLGLLTGANYQDARELLTRLQFAHIPEDLRFIIERYSELLGQHTDSLATADRSLTKAAALIKLDQRAAALEHLETGREALDQAALFLEALRAATETLGRRLGVFATPPDSPLQEAYRLLEELLARLEALRTEYAKASQELIAVAQTPGATITPEAPTEATVMQRVAKSVTSYITSIEANIPERGYPGRPLDIRGRVTSPDGPDPSTVTVHILLDEEVLDTFTGPVAFQREVRLPENTLIGTHPLTLVVPSQGLYEGSQFQGHIEVLLAHPRLTVRSPAVAFLPRSLPISGYLISELGPLQGSRVTLQMGGAQEEVRTNEEGRFHGSLELPLTALLLGPQSLTVTVDPQEPWHQGVSQQVRLFVVNVFGLSMVVLVVGYLLAVALLRWGRPTLARPAPVTTPGLATVPRPPQPQHGGPGPRAALQPWAFLDAESPRGRVLAAYFT